MKKNTKHNCYLCGNSKLDVRRGIVRDAPSIRIYECSNCGLVQLGTHEQICKEFYEKSGMHGEEIKPMPHWLRETEWDDQRRFDYLKNVLPNKRVLDFGSGGGGFLLKAQSLASDVSGIELEQRVIEYWKRDLKIYDSIEAAFMDNTGKAGGGYDVITAFHVLEHLTDPRKVLEQLSPLLKKNGRLIIEVPNADDALLTLYDCNKFQEFTYWSQHLYLFTFHTLNLLVKQAGFKMCSIKHVQRYPLSNHMYWLSRGLPGGHDYWNFIDTPELTADYAKALASVGKTDTLIAHIQADQ